MTTGFLRRGLAAIFRPANLVAPIAADAREAARGLDDIASIARVALSREPQPPEAADLRSIRDDGERFTTAMIQAGMSEADLPRLEGNLRRRLTGWMVFLVLSVLLAIVAPKADLIARTGFPILDHALPWVFAVWVATRAALASLRLFQVQARALVSVWVWLRDPAAWLGAKPSSAAALVVALAFLFMPGNGLAAEPAGSATAIADIVSNAIAATHANDLSLEWLRRMFSGAGVVPGSPPSGSDALVPLFTMFNSGLFFLGTLVLMWQTLCGLVYAAHTGKVFSEGSKYHVTWAPIRLCVGVAAIVPIKGYCVAQLLVIGLLSGGYMFTNALWSLYVDRMLSPTSSATVVAPRLDPGRNLTAQILQLETCAFVVRAAEYEPGWWDRFSLGMFRSARPVFALPEPAGSAAGSGTVWDYGQVCGSLKLDGIATSAASLVGGQVASAAMTSTTEKAAYEAFDSARVRALGTFVQAVRNSRVAEIVRDSVTPNPREHGPGRGEFGDRLQQALAAGTAYTDEMNRAARDLSAKLDEEGRRNFRISAAELGWAGAGSLNFTLTRISAGVMARAASGMPEIVAPNPERLTEEVQRRLRTALGELGQSIIDARERDYVSRNDIYVAENRSSWNPISWLLKEPSHMIARGIANAAELDAVNPMASMTSLGNATLMAGEALLISWVSANVAASSADATAENAGIFGFAGRPFTAAGKGLLDVVAPWMVMFISALLTFGALHAYVLPMVPFIMWFFAVIGCAVFAFEAVVAMPLAALAHMRMDGDELVGQQQRPYWVLAFNAALRPSLLLFGLIGSNILFAVMAGYLNKTFALAMLSSMGDSIIGFVGQIVMLGLLLYLHYQIAIRCMGLVHQVPAMVSRLLGADDGERGERDATSTIVAAAASFTKNAGAAALRVGGQASKVTGEEPGQQPGADRKNEKITKRPEAQEAGTSTGRGP